ncbi:hypothetical protein [Streptomyces sp. NPDC056188]|uniref:hypothetical protein n=1 Tax=Streptomyces sp. NPDC056188 TaxID=3345740 RepID=UPI0035DD2BF6
MLLRTEGITLRRGHGRGERHAPEPGFPGPGDAQYVVGTSASLDLLAAAREEITR